MALLRDLRPTGVIRRRPALAVLLGITVLVLFTCLGLTLGYAYFLHVKSMR